MLVAVLLGAGQGRLEGYEFILLLTLGVEEFHVRFQVGGVDLARRGEKQKRGEP